MLQNPQKTADLVTFTEEILDEKFHFFFAVAMMLFYQFEISFSEKISTDKDTFLLSSNGKQEEATRLSIN